MVSLVLVAHSAALLAALRELIVSGLELPPEIHLAGGTDDRRLGTSLTDVRAALEAASGSLDGTLVLYDCGSAWLTISFALDDLEPARRARVVVSDAPLVEGAMAAAARAAQGAPLGEVVDAAERALVSEKRPLEAFQRV